MIRIHNQKERNLHRKLDIPDNLTFLMCKNIRTLCTCNLY